MLGDGGEGEFFLASHAYYSDPVGFFVLFGVVGGPAFDWLSHFYSFAGKLIVAGTADTYDKKQGQYYK